MPLQELKKRLSEEIEELEEEETLEALLCYLQELKKLRNDEWPEDSGRPSTLLP